jgi:hypothetical protein
MAAGVAAQLTNFYGVEGIGMRHRLGAIPAPGGLEMLALAGPASLPTPQGMVAGERSVSIVLHDWIFICFLNAGSQWPGNIEEKILARAGPLPPPPEGDSC